MRTGAGPVEWVVTGIFYEAVHLIEAALALRGIDSASHYKQEQFVQQNGDLSPVLNDLMLLNNEADEARYRCSRHTDEELDGELIPALENIRTVVSQILGR